MCPRRCSATVDQQDLNNCHGNLSLCQTMAVCDGGDNDLLCRCRRGYYFHQQQCHECRTSCPEAHYLLTPCSSSADAVCTPCTHCSGSQYEAAVCTSTRDTICVDVTFPVGILPMNSSHYQDDGTPISHTHSPNVFLERLVHLKELETPMYVTNNQQTQDFVWHRESGIDIVVGISGVYLIPEYREMPAADDSQFFLTQSMETQRILDQFSSVQKEYCRHPVPDYYYLHLEVIRNRTTAAQVVRCDSRDPSQPRCPQGYKDGDRYLKWDINKHCNKFHPSGQPSDPLPKLKDGFNTVVCTDETDLDRDIFQLSRPVTLEMMFPSEECSQARQQCTQCLSSISAGCSEGDKANSCCGLSCYKKGACHKFHGPGCPQAAVECASGEVHRFTVMPVFSSMGHEWQCHLTYHQPAYLYNVSYSLSIPSLGFTVPAQTYTATAQTLYHHRHHSSKFHFIQVWHDTRMMVFRDILLKGNHQELNATSLSHMQPYVMHSLKDHSEFSRRKGFFTSKKEESAYTTTVQFERPFLYSSTSWYSNGCMKNVSGIFPNQTLYRNDAVKVTAKKVDRDGSFWYQVSHSDRSPYIKLSVAAGESVLQWFQGQTSQGTIIGESLKGLLVWVHTQNHWTITISGAVKECPSILTLHIFRKMMSSCAGIYDMLVACPKNFTLTFNVSRTDDNLPDIFVVKVKDMRSSHQLVLTSVLGPVNMPLTPLQARQQSVVMGEGADWFLWPSVLSVLVIAALGLAVICSIHAFIKHSAGKAAGSMAAYSTQPQETATLNNQATKPAEPRHHQSPLARRCLCIFVILYIIYSIVFSFCATLGLLYLTHHAMMVGVGGVSNFSQELQRELNASFHKVQLHESQEEVRLFHCVESRLQACSHHLQKQNREFLIRYQKYVTDLLSHVYLEQGAIQSLADQSIVQNKSVYAEEINQFLVDCNKTVQSILERFDSHFVVHAKEVTRNGWLDFPREIFLIQDEEPPNRKYMSSDQLARFFHWMLADKTDELFAISDTMSSRLSDIKLPSPSDHLKHIVTSPFEALLTSLPSEPRVAAHTFLLLDAPPFPAPSSHPSISSQHSLPAFLPHPRAALLYSEGPSDRSSIMGDGNISQPHNGSHSQPHVGRQGSHEKPSQSDGKEDAESGVVVYILIGLFLLMDVLLLVFRMYWLVNQLRAARAGYEDRIPTDPVCQKLLALQTGHPLSGLQEDVYQLPGYPVDTKDPMAEERTSENEFKVYFCQTYPKSKDDILREIMVQKISSTEQNLGQDRPPENLPLKQSQQGSRAKGRQTVRTCCYWLYRLLISHLLWQFVLTSLLVVMVCVVMYAGDWWLTTHNLRILVGGQSALRDLQLQVHMTNHHLAGLSTHLSTVLDSHTASVQSEIALATALLSSTLNIQRELLESLLARVCSGAGITICNTSSFNAVPLPELPTWQACNFLPTQPHLYQDVSGENLDEMVGQQLSPLLLRARHSVSSLGAVVVGVLCLLFLCQAGAVVGRCYLLVWGHLPRIHIFQISENTSMLLDNGPQGHRPMQRSSSWLESCESGVYVGDNEGGDTAQHHHHPQPNRDV